MSTQDGGQAFPSVAERVGQDTYKLLTQGGMTLRDYFAAKAMQGWLAGWPDDAPCDTDERKLKVALFAYSVADAMLKARKV
jgi:hypothetical protein